MATSVTANFPISVLTPVATIITTPTYLSIRTVQRELNANAASVHSYEGGANHGLLTLTITPQAYLVIAGVPFVPPVVPPVQPILNPGNTAAQISEAVRQHTEDKRVFLEYRETDKALVKMLIAATPLQYIKALEHPEIGYTNLTCLQILTHLYTEYGNISLHDMDDNQQRMNADWNPPTPIEDLFSQLDHGVLFALAAGEPIVDRQVARMGYNIVTRTGQFTEACREWRLRLPADQTYALFKTFFLRMNQDRQQSQTSAQAGYGNINNVNIAASVAGNTEPSLLTFDTQQANSVAQLSAELASLMTEVKQLRVQVQRQHTPPASNKSAVVGLSYCWTHGYVTNKSHNSRTCTNKAEGHVDTATATNNKGGTTTTYTPRRR
jgi:hypothetical protein